MFAPVLELSLVDDVAIEDHPDYGFLILGVLQLSCHCKQFKHNLVDLEVI